MRIFAETFKQIGGAMSRDLLEALRPSIVVLLEMWDPATERFLARLDHLDPRLRYRMPRLFPRYVRFGLREALAGTAAPAFPSWGPGLVRLGQRLRGLGFELSDYDTLGAAALTTMEEVLGEAFDAELREAWVRFYRMVLPALMPPGRQG